MADEKACTRCRIVKPLAEFTLLKRRSGKEYASLCRKCDRERTRDMRLALRLLLLANYSGGVIKCAICSEDRIDVLDLDHIEGGGIQERKKFKTPFAHYRWIRDSGFPKGYRVLCRNCNWIAWIERKNRSLK